MSYIEREAAKTAIMNYISEQTVSRYASSAECKAARSGAEGAFNEIDYLPDADVVEVVRCKDCKHYKDWGNYTTCQHWTLFENVGTEPNAFCSYGERREE